MQQVRRHEKSKYDENLVTDVKRRRQKALFGLERSLSFGSFGIMVAYTESDPKYKTLRSSKGLEMVELLYLVEMFQLRFVFVWFRGPFLKNDL